MLTGTQAELSISSFFTSFDFSQKTALGYEYQISPPDEVPPIAGQKHSSSSLPDRERETRGRPLPPLTFTFHLSSIAPLDNLYFSVYSDLTTDQVNEKGENIK